MKNILFLIVFFFSYFSSGAIKTTIANGDWFNPSVWSPSGVPMFEDTVVINHNITVSGSVDYAANWMIVNPGASVISDSTFGLHGNLKLFGLMDIQTLGVGDGDSALIYGTLSGGISAMGNPYNINYGTVNTDTLTAGEGFINSGLIDIMQLVAGGTYFTSTSGAAINVSQQSIFSTSGNVNIELNSTVATAFLVTNADMINNGDITAGNWTHGSGTVSGTTGRFCVAQCFINNATITGTVDICDASPGGFCDMDMGSISGTVTYCQSGTCADNTGLTENESQNVSVFPNPADDFLFIDAGEGFDQYVITDMSGRVVMNGKINDNTKLDVREMEKGSYVIIIMGDNKNPWSNVILIF